MYVDIVRIAGDIYVRGRKIIFAVDFKKDTDASFEHVDWLIAWAKIGLMSCGHTVPESAACSVEAFKELAAAPSTSEFTGGLEPTVSETDEEFPPVAEGSA